MSAMRICLAKGNQKFGASDWQKKKEKMGITRPQCYHIGDSGLISQGWVGCQPKLTSPNGKAISPGAPWSVK